MINKIIHKLNKLLIDNGVKKSWLNSKKGMLKYPFFKNKIDSNDKVYVIGLPKSGNVWLYMLLADSMKLNCIRADIEKGNKGVCMTHSPHGDNLKYRSDIGHVVYIMRDIRDIVVSYYKYSQTDDYRENMDPSCYFNNIEDFYFQYFLSQKLDRYNWVNHADYYVGRGVPMIRYEDLYDNTYETLLTLFKRWGVEIHKEDLLKAIEANDITKLQKTGKKADRYIPSTHFRKGGYGNYKEEMPEKILIDINVRFRSYLERWGYDV